MSEQTHEQSDVVDEPLTSTDEPTGDVEEQDVTEVAQEAPALDVAAEDGAEGGADDNGAGDEGAEAPAGSASARRQRHTPSKDELEREGEIAADFLESLLDICDLDGDLDVDIDGDRAAVSIVDSEEGRVPRRLVGTDAKVLDALQELTRLAVYAETGERSRLVLDIAGHRSDRRSILMSQASEAISKVKETGEHQALEPMSAYERKIVHDEVLAAGLRSESDGVEPRRYVVVHPA